MNETDKTPEDKAQLIVSQVLDTRHDLMIPLLEALKAGAM
jgi:hypothetical protein